MKSKRYYALYGNTCLKRGYCSYCKTSALIFDNKFACCDRIAGKVEANSFVKMCETVKRRKKPSQQSMKKILIDQDDKCYYCGNLFGDPFIHPKTHKLNFYQVCWDHYVPYSYSQNNKTENFVAACQVCNGIKTNKIFDSTKLAVAYIMGRRAKKGFDSTLEEPHEWEY